MTFVHLFDYENKTRKKYILFFSKETTLNKANRNIQNTTNPTYE